MSRDIASIKDDAAKRLAVVEATKFDKEDAQKALHDADKVHEQLRHDIAQRQTIEAADKQQKINDTIHADHEARQRITERSMYIAAGALAILQIVIAMAK